MNKRSGEYSNACPWYLEGVENHCLTCIKRNLSLLSDLSKEELVKLDKHRATLYFGRGENVFRQGLRPSGLYALSSGKAKNIRRNESGGTHVIGLNQPVNFLGFGDFLCDQTHSYSCVCIENCSVCFIPGEVFFEVLRNNSALSLKSLQFVSKNHSEFLTRYSNLLGKNMRGRMADTLIYIYNLFNIDKKANSINIDLTRSDYGSFAQMNTANAIRTLSEFSKSGLIKFEGTTLHFLNVKGLQQISLNE